uniref:Uncharacterized protein n=1 Tax=Meloidogyne enterolobii TaxID=390850 RepID=A0A6V7YDZ2_MELEN|nr:unnamed protein product [Meloidogyne enterolobii]
MIILLFLIIFGIIPIKLASQTNTNENKFSSSNPGSSSFSTDISSKSKFTLNPNASEYIPAIEQQVIHRQCKEYILDSSLIHPYTRCLGVFR